MKKFFIFTVALLMAFSMAACGSNDSERKTVDESFTLHAVLPTDAFGEFVGFHLEEPGHNEEGHVHRDLYINRVFINVKQTESTVLRFGYGTSLSSRFYTYTELTLIGSPTGWKEFPIEERGIRLAVYPYWQLMSIGGDIEITEIVFLATYEDSGDTVLVKASIQSELTNVPENEDAPGAEALRDNQFKSFQELLAMK